MAEAKRSDTESDQPDGSDEPGDPQPADEPRRSLLARLGLGRGRRLGWNARIAEAVAVLVVAMGIVTAIEAAAGAPLAHLVGGTGSSGGTTVGRIFSGGSNPHHKPGSGTSNTRGGSSGTNSAGSSGTKAGKP